MKDMVLKGLYRVHKPLKETDRSFIFEGTPVSGKTDLIIKILKDRYGRNATFLERYANDVQVTAALPAHENLANILDADFISKRYVVVTERFDGRPLAEILKKGTIPYHRVLAILRQLVTVMGLAYREGLPFRHIEMDNVLVNEETACLKVLKFTTPRSATASATRNGRSASGLGPDLYLAGTLLFRALVGDTPFKHRTDLPEIEVDRLKYAVMENHPELTPGEVHSLSNLFIRSTSRDITKRFRNSEAFLEALSNLEKQSVTLKKETQLKKRKERRASLDTAYDTVAALTGRSLPPTASPIAQASTEERLALGAQAEFLESNDDEIRQRLVWKRDTSTKLGDFLSEEGPTLTTLIILLVVGIFLATLYIVLS